MNLEPIILSEYTYSNILMLFLTISSWYLYQSFSNLASSKQRTVILFYQINIKTCDKKLDFHILFITSDQREIKGQVIPSQLWIFPTITANFTPLLISGHSKRAQEWAPPSFTWVGWHTCFVTKSNTKMNFFLTRQYSSWIKIFFLLIWPANAIQKFCENKF